MTRLILLRHGESLWNRELRLQGHTDIDLSDEGRRQADLAARRLARESIDVIYSSDSRRAHETAEIVGRALHLPVAETFAALRDRRCGVWEGLTLPEMQAQYPDLVRKWREEGATDSAPPGGETVDELCERALKCLGEILAKHPDETVLVVSHSGPVKAALCDLLAVPRRHFGRLRVDNTAITIAQITPERRALTLFNDTNHLHIDQTAETDVG